MGYTDPRGPVAAMSLERAFLRENALLRDDARRDGVAQLRGVTPNGASPATPPSSAVRTHGPSGVIATVCSKCAAREPSLVTTVQPSSSSTVAGSPTVTIGSMARVRPGTSLGPRPGRP